MPYRVLILPRAKKQLARLPVEARQRIYDAIRALGSEPRRVNSKKLKGRSGYRLRVGDYRVIYTIDDDKLVITIVWAGQRGHAYE